MNDHSVSAVLPTMMKVKDVANRLGCSTRTVYRLIETNQIPTPIRIFSSIRWERCVIEQWITNQCSSNRESHAEDLTHAATKIT